MSEQFVHWPSREYCWDCIREQIDYLEDMHELDLLAATDPEAATCRQEFDSWIETDPDRYVTETETDMQRN